MSNKYMSNENNLVKIISHCVRKKTVVLREGVNEEAILPLRQGRAEGIREGVIWEGTIQDGRAGTTEEMIDQGTIG
jgi:hypothetical protein